MFVWRSISQILSKKQRKYLKNFVNDIKILLKKKKQEKSRTQS